MMSNPALQHWSLLAERSLLLLIDVTFKSVILIAAAGLLALTLRRASAAQRHLVWLMTLGAALCLPLPSALLPSREVRAVSRAVHVEVAPPSAPLAPLIQPLPAPPHTDKVNGNPAPAAATAETNPPTAQNSPVSASDAKTFLVFEIGMLSLSVFTIWLLGVILVLGRTGLAMLRLHTLQRGLMPLTDPRMTSVAAKVVGEMDTGRPVRILGAGESSALTVPLTWGFWRPVIVLPYAAAEWPEERLRAALLHEMGHVRRGDWLAQMLATVACTVYWFNPLVWLAARAMRQQGERAADDFALAQGLRPSDYASHLMEIARTVEGRRQPPRQAVAMVRQSKIEARLRAVLARGRRRQQVTWRLQTTALGVTACLLLATSLVRFSSRAAGSAWAPPSTPTDAIQTATVAEPTAASVALPNGAQVRLAGVADTQSLGTTRWWVADGSSVTEALPRNTLVFPSLPADVKGRAFAVGVTYEMTSQPRFVWAAPPNFPWAYAQEGDERLTYYTKPSVTWAYEPDEHIESLNHLQSQETTQGSRTNLLTVDAHSSRVSQKTVVLKYGVAAGPWTESVTCKKTPGKVYIKTPSGDVIFTLVPNPHRLSAEQAARGSAVFMVSDHFRTPSPVATTNPLQVALRAGENLDRAILALDSSGRVVADLRGAILTSPDDSQEDYRLVKTMQNTSIPNGLLRRIASFRLLARPFQWAEFRNVQLQPRVTDRLSSQTTPLSSRQIEQGQRSWIAPPKEATTRPLTFENRIGGKLLSILHAESGYDPPTETLRQVTVTNYRNNGSAGSIVECKEAQWHGGVLTMHNATVSSFGKNSAQTVTLRATVMRLNPDHETLTVTGGGVATVVNSGKWSAKAQRSMTNLRRISLTIQEYIQDNNKRLPPLTTISALMNALKPYLKQQERFPDPASGQPYVVRGAALFVSPLTGQPYRPATALSETPIAKVARPAYTVVLTDGPTLVPSGRPPTGGACWVLEAFADGHVMGRAVA